MGSVPVVDLEKQQQTWQALRAIQRPKALALLGCDYISPGKNDDISEKERNASCVQWKELTLAAPILDVKPRR